MEILDDFNVNTLLKKDCEIGESNLLNINNASEKSSNDKIIQNNVNSF